MLQPTKTTAFLVKFERMMKEATQALQVPDLPIQDYMSLISASDEAMLVFAGGEADAELERIAYGAVQYWLELHGHPLN